MEDWFDRLQKEQEEMRGRLTKLVDFMNTKAFFELSANYQKLLKNQRLVMELYMRILNLRVFGDVKNTEIPDYDILYGLLMLPDSSTSKQEKGAVKERRWSFDDDEEFDYRKIEKNLNRMSNIYKKDIKIE